MRFQPVEHFARAVNGGAFFVAGDQQTDRAFTAMTRLKMGADGTDKGGNGAFHVRRTAPP